MLAASGTALLLVLLQLVTKATRDALFLSNFPASSLPAVMIAAAAASWAVAMGASVLLARMGPLALLSSLAIFNLAGFLAEWSLAGRYASTVAVVLYLHLASFGSLTVSTFWSLVNERFDPHRARQVMGRVNGGATLGGVLGGLLAVLIGPQVEIADLLLVSATASGLALIGARLVGPGQRTVFVASPLRGLFRETPYLAQVALIVALVAMGSAFADYTLKARAAAAGLPLVAFFAKFYTLTALVTFFIQSTLSRRVLASVGLTPALGALPAGYGLAAAGAGVFGGLPAAVLFSGTDLVLGSSLYRSGYELLYTPLAPAKKRRLKLLFDVGVARLGDALGGLLLLALSSATAPFLGIVTAALALLTIRRLKRGYVDALATSLRSRTISLTESDLETLDRTTRATFHSTVTLDRHALLREIEDTRALAAHIERARALGQTGDASSAQALMEMIEHSPLELASAAADALGVLVAASPSLAPSRSQVLAWVSSALEHAPPGDDALARDQRRRVLEHVLRLFGLTFDAELISAARRALSSDDLRLRGTALELLESLAPGAALMTGGRPR